MSRTRRRARGARRGAAPKRLLPQLRPRSGAAPAGHVRRGSRVYVDANTISGSTSSELDLQEAPDDANDDSGSDDGPMVEIRAKTVSGDIAIARAAAPTPIQAG